MNQRSVTRYTAHNLWVDNRGDFGVAVPDTKINPALSLSQVEPLDWFGCGIQPPSLNRSFPFGVWLPLHLDWVISGFILTLHWARGSNHVCSKCVLTLHPSGEVKVTRIGLDWIVTFYVTLLSICIHSHPNLSSSGDLLTMSIRGRNENDALSVLSSIVFIINQF